jgi:hypothetical protein
MFLHMWESLVTSSVRERRVGRVNGRQGGEVEEQPTCGEGLAENATLPARLGAVSAAMADVLEVHMRALDTTETNAEKEHDAYARLVDEHRENAASLRSVADHMAGCQRLPMAAHDESAMTSPEAREAFAAFVSAKQQLLYLLREQADQDRQMLSQMRRTAGEAN